jgi:hypothetical protein
LNPKTNSKSQLKNIKHDHYKSYRKVDKEKQEEEKKLHNPSFTQKPPPRDIYAGHSHVKLSAKKKRQKTEFDNNAGLSI